MSPQPPNYAAKIAAGTTKADARLSRRDQRVDELDQRERDGGDYVFGRPIALDTPGVPKNRLILVSKNGFRFEVEVEDDGTLSTVAL